MTRGIVGAFLGLIVGWMVGAMLQRIVGWIGVNSLIVILTVIVGAVLGASIGGLAGGLAGGVVGAIFGIMAIQLLFFAVKLITMAFGAALGWRWATASQ